jgi:catechol 2,3-dioxygenase-like lactoylglutathione lyase family enzyme
MSTTTTVPGLTGIEHIGLTVPDVDAASAFFADVLGGETLYDIGPFGDADDWMANHLAPVRGAHIYRMRVVRIANGPVLELMQFSGPSMPTALPTQGGWHMAFYVDDMENALSALKAHEVAIQSGPVTMTEGPSAGLQWLYFQAPWGQQLELVSYPGGIAAYRERRLDIWRPR